MAGGKTYHGLGDLEAALREQTRDDARDGTRDETLDDEEPRGVHSGPTVVDELKLEQQLERLKSLDQPPTSAGGVIHPVVDHSSSAKTHIAEGARPTAVGHSIGTPIVSSTIASDPLRGTMFGHSIHLPEINTPEDLPDDVSSRALQLVDPSAPVGLAPFPLADEPLPPGVAVPRAEPLRPPPRLDPFHRSNDSGASPLDEATDQLLAPRARLVRRIALAAGGVALVAVVAVLLVRGNDVDEPPLPPRRPPSPAPSSFAASPPSGAAQPAPPGPEAAPAPGPSPAPAPRAPGAAESPPAAPRAASRGSTPLPEVGATPQAEPSGVGLEADEKPVEVRPIRTKRRASRTASPDDEGTVKATRPSKQAPIIEEDPDATLPPTSLD